MSPAERKRAALRRRILRIMGRGLTTADVLSETCGVSVRTVYRYIKEMRADGQPIIGEAGAGYLLRRASR